MISNGVKKAIAAAAVNSLYGKRESFWSFLSYDLLTLALHDTQQRKQEAEAEIVYLLSASDSENVNLEEAIKTQTFLIHYYTEEIETIQTLLKETTNA